MRLEEKRMIVAEVVKENGGNRLILLLAQDYVNPNQTDLKGLAILNQRNEKNPMGMCAGFAMAQAMLMANVYFKPEEEKKSANYYREVIESALSGKQMIAAGVSNIMELTESVEENILLSRISELQSSYNKFLDLSIKWFKRDKLNEKFMRDMKDLAEEGIYTPISFVAIDGVRAEHMLIVYGVKEEKDRYQILVYDPNLGLLHHNYSLKYWISKKDMSISTNAYKTIKPGTVPTVL